VREPFAWNRHILYRQDITTCQQKLLKEAIMKKGIIVTIGLLLAAIGMRETGRAPLLEVT
jgi:hypothetical protein